MAQKATVRVSEAYGIERGMVISDLKPVRKATCSVCFNGCNYQKSTIEPMSVLLAASELVHGTAVAA